MTKVCDDENDRREVFQKEQKPNKKHRQLACFSHEKLNFNELASKRKKRVLIQFQEFIRARFFSQRERRSEKKHRFCCISLVCLVIVRDRVRRRKSTFESGREREREKKRKNNGENDFGW